MVVKRFLQSFSLPGTAPLLMTCVLLLDWDVGQAADTASPETQQSPIVPLQGYAPPGYNPPQPGYEYVPNPQYNGYSTFDYDYGGPTYIQRKAQAPYVTEYGGPLLEEWQYSGGYQGALDRGEIHYQPGSGDNGQMATSNQVRGQ
ncbi:hypothetical protein PJI16_05665 [Nitrospira sp. MA-1]|nr:hypothetical protein [Nitrospira sp. MA-1]